MAVLFLFEPLVALVADCEKKYESFGIFRDDILVVLVVPFMETDNGFGDNERAGETGPIEFK